MASLAGLLVAVPLSMGIAMASGVPAVLGILSALVGCLVTGIFSGAPLMMSGPAAGLIAVVLTSVHQFGLPALGLIVLLAGGIQLLAGALRVGQIFRMVPSAVIHGLMAGIGAIIVLSQFYGLFDRPAPGEGLVNLLHIPQTLPYLIPGSSPHFFAFLTGLITLAAILGHRFLPGRIRIIPASLFGILIGSAVAQGLSWPVAYVQIPDPVWSAVHLPAWSGSIDMQNWPRLLLSAFSLAAIASTKALLTASAVERMAPHATTCCNREMMAQGLGNMAAGLLGSLPVSGEVVRSAANVQAGAQSRLSVVLVGLWILLFVSVFPGVLEGIPLSALAGLLLYLGGTLMDTAHVRSLYQQGKSELLIYGTTMAAVVLIDPLQGVFLGCMLGLLKSLCRSTSLEPALLPSQPVKRAS